MLHDPPYSKHWSFSSTVVGTQSERLTLKGGHWSPTGDLLGHPISLCGGRYDPKKVEAIDHMSMSTYLSPFCSLLGGPSYVRNLLPNFAQMA